MKTITIDDFHENNNKLWLLNEIHQKTGAFFNLFTIPGLCGKEFLESVKLIGWIDMIPHGWEHPHPRECQTWSYDQSARYLEMIEPLGLTKGFKAPGWQISDGMYTALMERGYWVADQHYNDSRRPPELKVHFHEPDFHFHVGHMGGWNKNEISLHKERLIGYGKLDYMLIKNII